MGFKLIKIETGILPKERYTMMYTYERFLVLTGDPSVLNSNSPKCLTFSNTCSVKPHSLNFIF